MLAIEANTFSGYGGLRQVELAKPQPAKDRVLVRVTAAGVTPLEYTILSGGHPRAKAPLVLGNEGAGVVEDAGDSGFAVGSRVMFTGPCRIVHEHRDAPQPFCLLRARRERPRRRRAAEKRVEIAPPHLGSRRRRLAMLNLAFCDRAVSEEWSTVGFGNGTGRRPFRVISVDFDMSATCPVGSQSRTWWQCIRERAEPVCVAG